MLEMTLCSYILSEFIEDYKFLGIMKRQFPEVPILGLTATATKNVIEDVKKILNIPSCVLFKASFNRPNLFYEVRIVTDFIKIWSTIIINALHVYELHELYWLISS